VTWQVLGTGRELKETTMQIIRFTISAIIAVAFISVVALAPAPARADPQHPTANEVNTVVDMLRFRSGMLTDVPKTVATYAVGSARRQFAAIDKQMTEVGGGPTGWRYLLGTSVFTAAGLNQSRALIVFYNPWIDTAVFTLWEARKDGRRIVDVDWVPGDLLRQTTIEPRPLWLRGEVYRPQALADAVVVTVKAVETRFGDAQRIGKWRDTLGIKNMRSYNATVAPILAMRLYAAQLRIKALAVPAAGEDPKLKPLRMAVAGLIETLSGKGFDKPLAEAKDTAPATAKLLAKINPRTMQGLAPVAFVAGEGHATVFFASTLTADFAMSARYAERVTGYALQQLEFIPYAAIYQAAYVRR
jgi:hypothetical protein